MGVSLSEMLGESGFSPVEGEADVLSSLQKQESDILKSLSEGGDLPAARRPKKNVAATLLAALGDVLHTLGSPRGAPPSNYAAFIRRLSEAEAERGTQSDLRKFQSDERRRLAVGGEQLRSIRSGIADARGQEAEARQEAREAAAELRKAGFTVREFVVRAGIPSDKYDLSTDDGQIKAMTEALPLIQDNELEFERKKAQILGEIERENNLEEVAFRTSVDAAMLGLGAESIGKGDIGAILSTVRKIGERQRQLDAEALSAKTGVEESQAVRADIMSFMSGDGTKENPGAMRMIDAANSMEELSPIIKSFSERAMLWNNGYIQDKVGRELSNRLMGQIRDKIILKGQELASRPPAPAPSFTGSPLGGLAPIVRGAASLAGVGEMTENVAKFLRSVSEKTVGKNLTDRVLTDPGSFVGLGKKRGSEDVPRGTSDGLVEGIGSGSRGSRASAATGGAPWATPAERDAIIAEALGQDARALQEYLALSGSERELAARTLLARAGE